MTAYCLDRPGGTPFLYLEKVSHKEPEIEKTDLEIKNLEEACGVKRPQNITTGIIDSAGEYLRARDCRAARQTEKSSELTTSH